jgi:hypothetical protein
VVDGPGPHLKTRNMEKDETATEFIQQLSNAQLFDQYRALELRKRYWKVEVKNLNDSENRKKLSNIELWMLKVWNEIVSRVDKLNYGAIEALINSGHCFSLLE